MCGDRPLGRPEQGRTRHQTVLSSSLRVTFVTLPEGGVPLPGAVGL